MTNQPYFEQSQQVKRELQSDASLLDKLRSAFDGKAEPFSFGGTVDLFQFGKQLSSGLWVALRLFRPELNYGGNCEGIQARAMETYCRNAEHLVSKGFEVPRFCIGTTYKGKAGIITEDVSANGQYEIDHPDGEPHCFVTEGEKQRKVFIDIDAVFRYWPDLELKYFANDAVLDLRRVRNE